MADIKEVLDTLRKRVDDLRYLQEAEQRMHGERATTLKFMYKREGIMEAIRTIEEMMEVSK